MHPTSAGAGQLARVSSGTSVHDALFCSVLLASQMIQGRRLRAARTLLTRCQPGANQPEFAGLAGHLLLSFCGLLLEVRFRRQRPHVGLSETGCRPCATLAPRLLYTKEDALQTPSRHERAWWLLL